MVVGVDVYAVTCAVSAFFAGLALGSAVWGKLADRVIHPLKIYAALELGVGASGIAVTLLLFKMPPFFAAFNNLTGPFAWTMPFVAIGLPAFLMGGTLPVLMRSLQPGRETLGQVSGGLYAANTAGAIAGTLATPFFLIPYFGLSGAAAAAAGANFMACVIAAIVDRPVGARLAGPITFSKKVDNASFALLLYIIAGGIALGYEVVWFKSIAQFLSSRAFAFGVMLATYLSGLALGGYFYARVSHRDHYPWITFGVLISFAGLSGLIIFAVIGPWLPEFQDMTGKWLYKVFASNMLSNIARFLTGAGMMVLVPTIFLGAAFPVAVRLVAGPASIGRDTGRVLGLNMAGGILGTFVTGFVLVPYLGLVRAMSCLAMAAAMVGGAAIVHGSTHRFRHVPVFGIVACVITISFLIPSDKFGTILTQQRGGSLMFYEESARGTVAVVEQQSQHNRFRRLYIQGVSNSGDSMTSRRYMRLQALLPLLIHKGNPKSALVVGLGTGITCGALLAYPDLESRVCVELLPAVVRAVPKFEGHFNVTQDPRVDIRIVDGRHDLLRRDRQYDLITLEPPPPPAAGVVNLYSREFYDLCSKRLVKNGLMAQWWPLPTQDNENSKSLVRSFLDAFPHVTLWTTELHEMLLIGANDPIILDYDEITRRFGQRDVRSALSEVGVDSPAALLATYITDREGLEAYAGNARPVTDNYPLIEYTGWVRKGEITRILPKILQYRKKPPLSADWHSAQAIAFERRQLMTFYKAGLHAYKGEKERWAKLMAAVIERDPDNPYYLWFVSR